jgi:hypothetical protein
VKQVWWFAGFSISSANAMAKSAPEMSALPLASLMRMSVPRRKVPFFVPGLCVPNPKGWADVEPVDERRSSDRLRG